VPSCLKSSSTRTATEMRAGSMPRRPAEIPVRACSAGTTTSGVFVNAQDCVRGGNGGGGSAGCWHPTMETAMNPTPAERFPNHYLNCPTSDRKACPVEVAVVNPTLSRTKRTPAGATGGGLAYEEQPAEALIKSALTNTRINPRRRDA
jgi:hypothetical protein